MRLVILLCDSPWPGDLPPQAEVHTVSAIPTRAQLRPLDAAAREVLPQDPTPSLAEIAAQPDVRHLGAPAAPPQQPAEELRVIVVGTDASLSAVLTRMMRGDYLWATVAYVPQEPGSAAATTWQLPTEPAAAAALAVGGAPRPVPVIRTDQGIVVAGSATIAAASPGSFTGEIIVDDATLVLMPHKDPQARFFGQFGVRLVPTTDAPGIAAVRLTTPPAVAERTGRLNRWATRWVRGLDPRQAQSLLGVPLLRRLVAAGAARPGGVDPESLRVGRAVQAGGEDIAVTIDGVAGRRPVERVTFYRHLRDLQIVRPEPES